MPGKHNAGGCGCCVDPRPCCAQIWDDVRNAYNGLQVSLINTSASPDPSTSYAFFESQTFGGITVYQCSVGSSNAVSEPAPPAATSIPISSGLNRQQYNTGRDPSSGTCFYEQSSGGAALGVQLCDPATVRLEGWLTYGIDTAPDWIALGFSCSAGSPCTQWTKVDGYTTTTVDKDWVAASGCTAVPYKITAYYLQDITTIPGGISLPLDVVPAYNPAGLITRIEWVP